MEQQVEPAHSAFFDVELFFDHVFNAAYDIFEDSFDTFEENAPLLLDKTTEDNMKALTMGFDSVFNIIQEKLEKNLNRWEEYSRANCFISIEESLKDEESTCQPETNDDFNLRAQEESLDAELDAVRSQLHAAGKESARLRRELRNLERFLALKQRREAALHAAVTQLKDNNQDDMLKELLRVASLLSEQLKKVKAERFQSPRGLRWMGAGQPDIDVVGLESIARTLAL